MVVIPKRTLILIAAAIALVLLVLVVVRTTVRPSVREHREQVAQSVSTIERARVSCAAEQNPDGCTAAAVNREARRLSDASLCEALEGEAFANCVSLVALDGENPNECGRLSGEERHACTDSVNMRLATRQMQLSLCERISSSTLQERCRANIEKEAVRLGQCAAFGIDDFLCSDAEAYRQAVASGNVSACDQFDEEAQFSCVYDIEDLLETDEDLDGLTRGEEAALGTDGAAFDTDRDGLSDGEEVNVYKTNPLERDTDGDGYADGEEVENDFNPNGEGRL
ncbi:MAG: hypothetical protein AAB570_02615 [Patescibacteria group bacterium]